MHNMQIRLELLGGFCTLNHLLFPCAPPNICSLSGLKKFTRIDGMTFGWIKDSEGSTRNILRPGIREFPCVLKWVFIGVYGVSLMCASWDVKKIVVWNWGRLTKLAHLETSLEMKKFAKKSFTKMNTSFSPRIPDTRYMAWRLCQQMHSLYTCLKCVIVWIHLDYGLWISNIGQNWDRRLNFLLRQHVLFLWTPDLLLYASSLKIA